MREDEQVFECPRCNHHNHKFYVNVVKGVFHCYHCDFSGSVSKLRRYPHILEKISDKATLAQYLKHTTFSMPEKAAADLDLDISKLSIVSERSEEYLYLVRRGWTDEMIRLYTPMVSQEFSLADRVILPIYDDVGVLTYYVARSIYSDVQQKYKNASKSKDGILFFSDLSCNVLYSNKAVICEGIFDAAKVPNAVALLGKTLSAGQQDVLYGFLRGKREVYVCLDKDTEDATKALVAKITSWYPSISVFTLNHSKFGEKDLGDLAKTKSSHELLSFIMSISDRVALDTLSTSVRKRIYAILN